MRDTDVRGALTARLTQDAGTGAHLLAHEVDIRWAVPARMDVLYVNERVAGFEIKSDVDRLTRLERQVRAYSDVVERAYLVVGRRHLAHALTVVPAWWGVWRALPSADGDVELAEVRKAKVNPTVNALAMTTFLSRSQLVAALREVGATNLSALRVDDLRALLVDTCGRERTIEIVRGTLRESAASSTAA